MAGACHSGATAHRPGRSFSSTGCLQSAFGTEHGTLSSRRHRRCQAPLRLMTLHRELPKALQSLAELHHPSTSVRSSATTNVDELPQLACKPKPATNKADRDSPHFCRETTLQSCPEHSTKRIFQPGRNFNFLSRTPPRHCQTPANAQLAPSLCRPSCCSVCAGPTAWPA